MACNTPPIKTIQTSKQLVFTTAAGSGGDQTFVFTGEDIEQVATLLSELRVSANGTVNSAWLTNTNWKRPIRVMVKAFPDAVTTLQQGFVTLTIDFRLVS